MFNKVRRFCFLIFALSAMTWCVSINHQVWGAYFEIIESRGILLKHPAVSSIATIDDSGWGTASRYSSPDILEFIRDFQFSSRAVSVVRLGRPSGVFVIMNHGEELALSQRLFEWGMPLSIPELTRVTLMIPSHQTSEISKFSTKEEAGKTVVELIELLSRQKALTELRWQGEVDDVDFSPLDSLRLERMSFHIIQKSIPSLPDDRVPQEFEETVILPKARVLTMEAESIRMGMGSNRSILDLIYDDLPSLAIDEGVIRLALAAETEELHISELPDYQSILLLLRPREKQGLNPLKIFINGTMLKSDQRITIVHDNMTVMNQETSEVISTDQEIWLNQWTGKGHHPHIEIKRQPVIWEWLIQEYWLDIPMSMEPREDE